MQISKSTSNRYPGDLFWKMDLCQLTKSSICMCTHTHTHTHTHTQACMCVCSCALQFTECDVILIAYYTEWDAHINDLVLELDGYRTKTKEITKIQTSKIQTSKQLKYVCVRMCLCVCSWRGCMCVKVF